MKKDAVIAAEARRLVGIINNGISDAFDEIYDAMNKFETVVRSQAILMDGLMAVLREYADKADEDQDTNEMKETQP